MEVKAYQILNNNLPPLPPRWKRLIITLDFGPEQTPNNLDELVKQFIVRLQAEGIITTVKHNPLTLTLIR